MAAKEEIILAGDAGGTKTKIALFSLRGGKLAPVAQWGFASKDYPDLESIVREALSKKKARPERACFGVAGPVVEGKSRTTNLPWSLDAAKIARSSGIGSVALINDLEATAYGIFTLDPAELATLNPGRPQPRANRAVIAAGTGLGEAILFWDGKGYRPSASEGGHADFAPRNPLEIDLLRYLMARLGHVSYERVVSGPGLFNIYNFLKESGRFDEPSWLAERLAREDPGAAISEAALEGGAEICAQALDVLVSIYGAEAGNLALKAQALGGLYLGGGIAPKILNKLKDGTFLRAFTDKGRYVDFLSSIPVHVILNEEAALRGAAHYAAFRSDG